MIIKLLLRTAVGGNVIETDNYLWRFSCQSGFIDFSVENINQPRGRVVVVDFDHPPCERRLQAKWWPKSLVLSQFQFHPLFILSLPML